MQEIPLDLVERSAVSAIRQKIKAHEREGCFCPVCEGIVKVYRRKLNSTMARQLITTYRLQYDANGNSRGVEWVDIFTICKDTAVAGGDFAKLVYWGLIEQMPHEAGDDGKKTSGMWRITDKGISFVLGHRGVKNAVFLLNGEVVGWDDKPATIKTALGEHFDYNELMRAA